MGETLAAVLCHELFCQRYVILFRWSQTCLCKLTTCVEMAIHPVLQCILKGCAGDCTTPCTGVHLVNLFILPVGVQMKPFHWSSCLYFLCSSFFKLLFFCFWNSIFLSVHTIFKMWILCSSYIKVQQIRNNSEGTLFIWGHMMICTLFCCVYHTVVNNIIWQLLFLISTYTCLVEFLFKWGYSDFLSLLI